MIFVIDLICFALFFGRPWLPKVVNDFTKDGLVEACLMMAGVSIFFAVCIAIAMVLEHLRWSEMDRISKITLTMVSTYGLLPIGVYAYIVHVGGV